MRNDDDLDLLLDSALSTYAAPGIGAGLERRILARIAAETAQVPRRRWWLGLFALPVAACLLLLVLPAPKRMPSPMGKTDQARPAEKSPLIAAHAAPQAAGRMATARKDKGPLQARAVNLEANAVSLPKLDVFPTPHPLTPAERRLAVFATRAPEPERESLVEAQKQAEEPLNIAAIHIPLLEPPDEGNN